MDYKKYLDLIAEGKNKEAENYRISCIPDTLYKYFKLDNAKKKTNKKILSTLKRGEIYLSEFSQFNDPFEGKALIFDDAKLREKGWSKEIMQDFVAKHNYYIRFCCFANPKEKHQNMPMWAYYANNHKGFCVEYEFNDLQKKFIYPVAYNEYRREANAIVGNVINGVIEMVKHGVDPSKMPGELNVYNHLMYLALTCKHSSWEHECEYRALVPRKFGQYFSAVPKRIYMGMKCPDTYIKRFKVIADEFPGCEIYKMQRTLENSQFYLEEKLLYKSST